MKIVAACMLAVLLWVPTQVIRAQELYQDEQGILRAEVLEILGTREEPFFGTNTKNTVQTLEVKILSEERAGETLTFKNDYIQLAEGDVFFLRYVKDINGTEQYTVQEVDRRPVLVLLGVLFGLVIIAFGGIQGARSLLALAGSLLTIAYILIPLLVAGYPPVPVSVAVASAVLFFAIFFTHGFNKGSTVAFGGTVLAVAMTGIIAYGVVEIASLTGLSSDESMYLNLNTGGQLNFVGLLLAAVIIGALGALDDIAITQVAVVRELMLANDALPPMDVYRRAMRVGKEHVGALVNTLVLAYTGAALPLLLLFSFADGGLLTVINREVIATEMVRTVIGSIGLVLAVPITTILAVLVFSRWKSGFPEVKHMHTHAHMH
ncbi:MAG: YibE/F family protein [Parcubacteria group bacterium]|nr:YibE/F family protein [Parcubacteria group bacterium]